MNLKPLSKSSVTNTNSISSIVHVIPRITNPTLINTPKKFYLPDDTANYVNPSATYWRSPNDLLITLIKRRHGYDFYNTFCHKTKSGSSLNGRKSNSTYKTAGKYRKFIYQYRNCNSNEKLVELLRQGFAQGKISHPLSAYYCEKVVNQNEQNGPKPKTSKDDACQIKKERIAQRNLDIYNIKTNIDGLCKSRIKKDDPCKPPKELQKPKLEPTAELLSPSKYADDGLLPNNNPWSLIKTKSLDPRSDILSSMPIDICDHNIFGEYSKKEHPRKLLHDTCSSNKKDICPASEDCAIENNLASSKQLFKDDSFAPGKEVTATNTKLASGGQDASSQPQNSGDGSMKVGGDGNNNRNAAWKKIKCKKTKFQCGPRKCKAISHLPTPKICHDVSKALDAINEMQKDPCKYKAKNNNVPYKIMDDKIVCQIKNMCCVLEKYDPSNPKHKNIPQPKAGDRQFYCKIKDMFCVCTKMDKQNGQYVAAKVSSEPSRSNTADCKPVDSQAISKTSAEEDFEKRMGDICNAFKKKSENIEGVSKNRGLSILESRCKVDDEVLPKVNSKEQIKTTKEESYQSPLQKLKGYLLGSQNVNKSLEKTVNMNDPKAKEIDCQTLTEDEISIPTTKPKLLSDVGLSNICERKTKPKQSLDTGISAGKSKIVTTCIVEPYVPNDPCKVEDAMSTSSKSEAPQNDITNKPCEFEDLYQPADKKSKSCAPEVPKDISSSTICIPQDPCESTSRKITVPNQSSCIPNLVRECSPKPVNLDLEDPCKDDLRNRSCIPPQKKAPCKICGDKIICEFEDRTCICEIYNPCKREHRDPPKLDPGDKKSICKIGELHCECTKRWDLFTKIKESCKSTEDSCKPSFPLCIDLNNGKEDSIRIENCKMIEGKVVIELQNTCCVCEKFDPCNPDHTNIVKPRSSDKIACCVIENMYCQCVKKSDVKMPTMARDVNASCSGIDWENALFQGIFDTVKLETNARAARRIGAKYPKIQQMDCSDEALKKAQTNIYAELCKKAKASCSFEGKRAPDGRPTANTNCDFDVTENTTVKSNPKACGKVNWAIPLGKKKDKSCEQLAKAICESIEIASQTDGGSKNDCEATVDVNTSPAKMMDVSYLKGDSANEMTGICQEDVEKPTSKINSMRDCKDIFKTECAKPKESQSDCSEIFKTQSNLQQNDCVENVETIKAAEVPQIKKEAKSYSVKANKSKIDCGELLKKKCVARKRRDKSKLRQDEPCIKPIDNLCMPQMSEQCRPKDIKAFIPEQLICDSTPSKIVKTKKICIPKMNQENKSLADACISKVTANNMKEENTRPHECNLYLKFNQNKSDEAKKQPINIYLNLDLINNNNEDLGSPSGGSKPHPRTLDPCVESKICKPQRKDEFECSATSSALKVNLPIVMADFCKKKKHRVDPCSKLDPPLPKLDHPSAKVDPCKPKITLPTNDRCKKISDANSRRIKINSNLKLDSKPTPPPQDNKNKKDPCKGNSSDNSKSKNDPSKQKNDPCATKSDSCESTLNSASKSFNCSDKSGSMKDPCGSKGSSKSKIDPCAPKEDPCASKVDPRKSKIDPCAPKMDPGKSKIDPCAPKMDPGKSKIDPCAPKMDPGKSKIDPCAPKEDPCGPKMDPGKSKIDPCAPKMDPGKSKIDPCAPKMDPGKSKIDPCAPKMDPGKSKIDPCAPKMDPGKSKIDPCAPKEDPCGPKMDPGKSKKDPCAPKEDPCKTAMNKSMDSLCGKSHKVEPNPRKPDDSCKAMTDPCKKSQDKIKDKPKDCSQYLDSCNKKPDPCSAKVDPCEKDIFVYPPLEEPKRKKQTEEVSKSKVDPRENKETICAASADSCKPKRKQKQKACEPLYIDPNRVDESLCTPLKPKVNYHQEVAYEVVKREVPPDQCKDQVRVVMSDMLKPKADPCKPKYDKSPSKTSMCVPLPESYKKMAAECKPVASAAQLVKLFEPTKEVQQTPADPRASVDSCTKAKEAKMKKDGSILPCCTKRLPKILADSCRTCDSITTRLGLNANVISKYNLAKSQMLPAAKAQPPEETKTCKLDPCKESFVPSNEDPCKAKLPKKCERKMDPCEIVTFPSATKIDICFDVSDEKKKAHVKRKEKIKKDIKIPLHKSEPKEDVESDMCKFSACNEDAPFNLQEELKQKQQYCTKAEPFTVEKETSKKEESIETHDGSKYDPCSRLVSCEIKQALKEAEYVTGYKKSKEDPCKPSGSASKLTSSDVNETIKPKVCAKSADTLQYPCPDPTSPLIAKMVCANVMVESFAQSIEPCPCDPNGLCKINPEMKDPKRNNAEMVEPKMYQNAPVMENTGKNVKIDDPCLNQGAVEDPRQYDAQYAASKAAKLKARLQLPIDSLCVKNKDPHEKEKMEKLKLSEEMCRKLKGTADENMCSVEINQSGKGTCKFIKKKPCADQVGGCPEDGTGKGSCYKDSCQTVAHIYDRPDCRPPPQQNQPPFKLADCPKTQRIPEPIDAETVTFPSTPRPDVPECTPQREICPPPFMNTPQPSTNTTCTAPSPVCCTEESPPLQIKYDIYPHCSVIYDASKHQQWCAVQVKGEPQVASGRTCMEYIKRRQQIDGITSTILPNLERPPSSPRFDVTLPKPMDEDKGIVAGTKGLMQSICSAICPMNKKGGDGKGEATGYTRQHANCEGVQPKAECTLLPECGSEEHMEILKAKSLKQWPFLEQIHKPGPNVLKGCQTKHDMQAYMANKRKCQPNPDDMPKDNLESEQTRNSTDPNAKWRKC